MADFDPSDIAYCAEQLGTSDPDRFATAMLADADARAALFAIYAFNLEIARTRDSVREAMLGRIRLQWWRDALDDCYSGQPRCHQVVQPLALAIQKYKLPREIFFEAIEAREQDLEDIPPPNEQALAAYVDATGGGVGRLASLVLGGDGEIGAKVGRAYAWVGLARALHAHRHAGRHLIPSTVLKSHPSLDQDAYSAKLSPSAQSWTQELIKRAEHELAETFKQPKTVRAAIAPASLTRTYCRKLRKADFNPFHSETVTLTPFARACVLLRFSVLGH